MPECKEKQVVGGSHQHDDLHVIMQVVPNGPIIVCFGSSES
jgi:hypothetical protein